MRVFVRMTAPKPLSREVQLAVGFGMTVRSGGCSLFVAVLKRLFFRSSVDMCRMCLPWSVWFVGIVARMPRAEFTAFF